MARIIREQLEITYRLGLAQQAGESARLREALEEQLERIEAALLAAERRGAQQALQEAADEIKGDEDMIWTIDGDELSRAVVLCATHGHKQVPVNIDVIELDALCQYGTRLTAA